MPAKRDRTEHPGLLRALIDDPWRKLISLGLATILWIYLDSQVSSDKVIEVAFHVDSGAAASDETKDASLALRFDTKLYAFVDAVDADDPEGPPIDNDLRKIKLSIKGAKRLVLDLLAAPRFTVQVDPTIRDGRPFIEFSAVDIRPVDGRYEGLLRGMVPARVRVDLTRNVKETLLLDKRAVHVEPPPNVSGFLDRLKWDDVKFSAASGTVASVTIQGPETVVRTYLNHERPLFTWRPDAPTTGSSGVIQAQLRIDPEARGISIDPVTVFMEVPLRAAGHEFTLANVPVVIVGDAARERFRLETSHVEVKLEAFDLFETKLGGFDPDQLRDWIAANCTVLAPIPANAPSEGGQILGAELHILQTKPEQWQMVYPPVINYSPKTP